MCRGNRRQPQRFLAVACGRAGLFRAFSSGLVALLLGGAPGARAHASSAGEWLVVSGACPRGERVREELLRLVPPERRHVLEAARIFVTDGGDTYRVSIESEISSAERLYDNPERECDRRARFAAVFSVVTLLPPELDEEPASSELEPSTSLEALKPEAPRRGAAAAANDDTPSDEGAARDEPTTPDEEAGTGREAAPGRALLELGFGAAWAPETPSSPRVMGAQLGARALLSGDEWAALVGVEWLPETSFQYLDVRGSLERGSALLGARRWLHRSPVGVGVELSVVGSFERVVGDGLVSVAEPSTTWSWGGRGRFVVESPSAWRVRPFVAGAVTWYPSPTPLVVEPRGAVATLPKVWLGGEIGIAWRLD